MRRLASAALVAAVLLPRPAAASSLPPLDFKRGQFTLGAGLLHVAGDVALADGLTLGAGAFSAPWATGGFMRAAWTAGKASHGTWGVLVAGGYSASAASPGPGTTFMAGPVYETGPGGLRLRMALLPGVHATPKHVYDTGREFAQPGDVLVGTRTYYGLSVWPVVEIVLPAGENGEWVFGGNQVVGYFGRW